jgi:hypothetical protein
MPHKLPGSGRFGNRATSSKWYGSSGTQILDSNDNLLLEASSVGVSVLRDFSVLTNSGHAISKITNTSGSGYASTYTEAAGVQGQIYTGAGIMSVSTNTNHKLVFVANRYVNPPCLTIETNGAVVCNTSFTNNSDSKLKDDQQPADLVEIQRVFDAIQVKTYMRNDLGDQKRIGFIAQEIEAALPEQFKHIVGNGTLKRSEESEEELIKTIDYSRLTALLWGMVKNLQNRIEILETKLS